MGGAAVAPSEGGCLAAAFPHRYEGDGSQGDARQHGGDVPGSIFGTDRGRERTGAEATIGAWITPAR